MLQLLGGDIGVLDGDGRVHITDRLKDMFIVGGFNAYPAEIEQILSTHPDIAQVAVIGVPDERMGEVGAAFVITRAARLGVLKILMNGMRSGTRTGTSVACRKRTKPPASRAPKLVAGVTPGSTALKRKRGFSRANANAAARMACLEVA